MHPLMLPSGIYHPLISHHPSFQFNCLKAWGTNFGINLANDILFVAVIKIVWIVFLSIDTMQVCMYACMYVCMYVCFIIMGLASCIVAYFYFWHESTPLISYVHHLLDCISCAISPNYALFAECLRISV